MKQYPEMAGWGRNVLNKIHMSLSSLLIAVHILCASDFSCCSCHVKNSDSVYNSCTGISRKWMDDPLRVRAIIKSYGVTIYVVLFWLSYLKMDSAELAQFLKPLKT